MMLFFLFFIMHTSMLFSQPNDFNIIINPTGDTPLSAVYILPSINDQPITIAVLGKDETMTIAVSYPAGYGTHLPIHGLYENFQNTVLIRIGKGKFNKYYIKTPLLQIPGSKKKDLPINRSLDFKVSVKKDTLPSPTHFNQDLFFVSMPLNGCIIGFDRRGDIRYYYYHKGSKMLVIRMLYEHNNIYFLLIDDYHYYQKMDLLGNPIFRNPMSVHHESVPYLNKQELILGNSEWGWEDMLFVLDQNKQIVKKFSIGDAIRDVVDPKDMPLLNQMIFDDKNIYIDSNKKKRRIDWAHANSLSYDKNNLFLYLSLRHLGILAISMIDWKLKWFITDDNLTISSGYRYGEKPKEAKYLTDIPSLQKLRMNVSPKNSQPRGQHSLFLKKNGNLMFFDNQADNKKNTNGSRILEYKLDHINKKANLVFLYQTPERNYSRLVSDVDMSGDNSENILILFGFGKPKRVVELNRNFDIIYDLEVEISGIFYRIDKFPLYPYRDKIKKYALDFLEENT